MASHAASVLDAGTGSTADRLAAALKGRDMLLLIDGCEHVLRSAAELVHAIARSCPTVTILATSRQRLRISGEAVFPLGPLSVSPSVELFVDRASGANARLRLTPEQSALIVEICQKLEELPLAIELRHRALQPSVSQRYTRNSKTNSLRSPGRLARQLADVANVRILGPTRELPKIAYPMVWNRRLRDDAAQSWLRSRVRLAAKEI